MQLSTVLSLVLAAAPATLLASPMQQMQQQFKQYNNTVVGRSQQDQSQQSPSSQDQPKVDLYASHGESISAGKQMMQAKEQDKQKQHQKGRFPTILGMSLVKTNVNQTQMVGDSNDKSGKSKDKDISKRHHMDLGAYFAHKKHPDCSQQESKCKNCGE